MDINNGDYNKDNQFINKLNYRDENNEQLSVTLQEEKLLEYFLYALQKRAIIKKDVNKEDFEWNTHKLNKSLRFKSNGEYFENIVFELDKRDLKTYLNVANQNYIQKIREVLSKFSKKHINYVRKTEDGLEDRVILPIRDFTVKIPNGKKEYEIIVSLNTEFLYLAIFRNGQYTPLNMNKVSNIRSKYSLQIYQEIEKALNLKHSDLPKRTLKSMNRFFGTNLIKQEMDKRLLRVKQEFLLNKMYVFDYEIYKNDNKEWIFTFKNVKKIEDNDILSGYIKSYLDFRLLTPEAQEKFELEYVDKFEEITSFPTNIKNIESRTQHLQRKTQKQKREEKYRKDLEQYIAY